MLRSEENTLPHIFSTPSEKKKLFEEEQFQTRKTDLEKIHSFKIS